MSLHHRDTIDVAREVESHEASDYETFEEEDDGETVIYEEVTVFNWVNVEVPAVVRGGNPVVEKFEADIGAGDSSQTPDAVTTWVAEELDVKFSIDPADHDIEIVEVTDDEVFVL